MKKTAFALLGPTAGGKSRLAMQLAGAHPVEIVSIDSAQVYRGMDIGTAKPSPAERRAVPHHLIDLIDPTERYSAGRFRADAIRAVAEIHGRGRIPLLVGGTMLYYRALSQGLDELPPADAEIRARIDLEASSKGWPALHAELAKLDPKTAARLEPGDAQRIQRALEVHRISGKPISAFQVRAKSELPFELKAFSLVPENRPELHRRIAGRFDAMLKSGLVEELKTLRGKFPLSAALPSMRCVGYRQAWDFLEGRSSAKELREAGIAATRQLAKRQLTWLRSLPGIEPAGRLAEALGRGPT
ncbi:MAG TPA: tRNA (adenosine(37)-N6)-dimethylallyltransferase MiaA [Burkholderiales bacterium]